MSWDSVPWFVGGGAQHSPEVARLVPYAATGGAEGIVNVGDLKVQALAVPGTSVRVLPGAALILARSVGGDSQTYLARNPTEDVVAISSTGSGSGRSDLIVAQIEDPFMAGEPWQDPTDPTVGPYVYTRVIPNVPAGTTRLQNVPGYSGRTAVTLARVDIPASTATITAAMIKDLRKVARPRRERAMQVFFPQGVWRSGTAAEMSRSGYATWPITLAQRPYVDVPTWATRVDIICHMSGIIYARGSTSTDTAAGVRTRLGYTLPASENGILVQDAEDAGGRYTYTTIGTHAIDAATRGTTQPIDVQAVVSSGNGHWYADYQSSIVLDWEFSEGAV